jgi:hypothetical protein
MTEKTRFKNPVVQEQYLKWIREVAGDYGTAHKAWIDTMGLFDEYVSHVVATLDAKSKDGSVYL